MHAAFVHCLLSTTLTYNVNGSLEVTEFTDIHFVTNACSKRNCRLQEPSGKFVVCDNKIPDCLRTQPNYDSRRLTSWQSDFIHR